jgi:hypothetical protein
MLVAYFDESGTHGRQSEVVTVAGLVGDTRSWNRIEHQWKKRLGAIETFHATDCAAGSREFATVEKHECDRISNDLASLIAAQKGELCAVGMSVYRDDWEYCASDIVKKQCKTMYHFCLLMVLLQVNQLSQERAGGEPVAFVFAKQSQYEDYALAIHEVFRQIETYSSIGHLEFGEPRCVVPLQAADLYAYETYRELISNRLESRPTQRLQLTTIDNGIEVRSRYAGPEFLNPTSEQIDNLSAPIIQAGGSIFPFA